jgi:hypothetical protein
MICQLHQLLLGLVPGGAKRDLSVAQARVFLASEHPRDVVARTRNRVALELVADLQRVNARKECREYVVRRTRQSQRARPSVALRSCTDP